MNTNAKSTSYKRTHQKIFKKLNSWATGTVRCGWSPLQQFLENTELFYSSGMFYLAKCFLEKQNTTHLNGRDAMLAALTINFNSIIFLYNKEHKLSRRWLASFDHRVSKIKTSFMRLWEIGRTAKLKRNKTINQFYIPKVDPMSHMRAGALFGDHCPQYAPLGPSFITCPSVMEDSDRWTLGFLPSILSILQCIT